MRKDDSMVFKPGFSSQDILKSICVVASLIVFCGCAHDYGVTLQDQKVINKGIYEVNSLNRTWLRIPNFGGHTIYSSSMTDDIVYLRCPEQQVIAITRATGGYLPKKDRTQFASYQEQERYLVEDYHEGAGTIVQNSFVSRAIQLDNQDAVEYEFLVSNPLRLCSRVEKKIDQVREKMIITRYSSPTGKSGWLVFDYQSPPDIFDQNVADFDQMVQSFQFTK